MQVVREISLQTAEGSTATSTSIAKLAALSAQLRKSAAGFRLPDYGSGAAGAPAAPGASAAPAANAPAANAASNRLPALNEPVNAGKSAKVRKASGIGA
jgi:twitching motility protein PilJ